MLRDYLFSEIDRLFRRERVASSDSGSEDAREAMRLGVLARVYASTSTGGTRTSRSRGFRPLVRTQLGGPLSNNRLKRYRNEVRI